MLIVGREQRSTCRVLLCDFGLCAKMSLSSSCALSDFVGSPGFFAPELLAHDSYDGRKADVWGLGCVLLETLVGHNSFDKTWLIAYKSEAVRRMICTVPSRDADSSLTVQC